MLDPTSSNELNKTLTEIHKTIVEWLKFAETKNAGLLAANLAVIFGIAQSNSLTGAALHTFSGIYLWNVMLFCGISAVLCLVSIAPQIQVPLLWARKEETGSDLIFFGSIATHTRDTYIKKFEEAIQTSLSQLECDLVGQIVVNARITRRKFSCFKWSAWLTLSAFLTPLVAAWLMVIREK